MGENLIELTDATFEEVVNNSDTPVLVDFWAPWCGPCKMIAPVIAELADTFAGRAKICKIDTEEHRDAAIEFGITAIPTVMIFKDGQVAKKWVGLTSKNDLTEALEELM